MQQVISASLLPDFLLAVEVSFLESSRARTIAWIVGTLVVLAAAWGASAFSVEIRRKARARQARFKRQSNDVFGEICTAYRLSPKEKRQLQRGATVLELNSPSLLFVDSSLLNQLANSGRDDAGEFGKLADRFFPAESNSVESYVADLANNSTVV